MARRKWELTVSFNADGKENANLIRNHLSAEVGRLGETGWRTDMFASMSIGKPRVVRKPEPETERRRNQ